MNVLQKTRNVAFWGIDFFKGKKVKKHLEDIHSILEDYPSEASRLRREKHLQALLKHATSTTEYYKKFSGANGLSDFPLINKNLIKANSQKFISNQFKETDLVKCTTSGSTGTPFVLYHDKNKKARNTADTIYFANRVGYKPGHKLFYLKIWSDLNHKSPLLAWMQNVHPVEVIRLSDQEIEKFINLLKKGSGTIGLLGYASAMEQICRYLDKTNAQPLKTNVHSVITMSETLNQYTKDALTKYFGIPAVARYSNIENGIIAQQGQNGSNEFHLNFASFVVEIFDMEKDVPAKEGELGRVVITDLFNYGMPFIRYDTGDIGSMSFETNSDFKTPVLTHMEGRKLDLLYNTSEELVSSLLVYKNMWKYTELDQYQLVQRGPKHYVMKINLEGTFQRSDMLIKEFKSFLGQDALFEIEQVDEIPLLNSGKRKKVVNEYYPSKK